MIRRRARRTCHTVGDEEEDDEDGERHMDIGTRRNTSPSAISAIALSPRNPVAADRYISILGHSIPTFVAQLRKARVAVGSSMKGNEDEWRAAAVAAAAVVVVEVVAARRVFDIAWVFFRQDRGRAASTQQSSPKEARETKKKNVKTERHQENDEDDCRLLANAPPVIDGGTAPDDVGNTTSDVEVVSSDDDVPST